MQRIICDNKTFGHSVVLSASLWEKYKMSPTWRRMLVYPCAGGPISLICLA